MTLTDYIIIAVVAMIIAAASIYIYRAKKNGQKCIGCPSSKTCSGSCQSCSAACPHATAEKEKSE